MSVPRDLGRRPLVLAVERETATRVSRCDVLLEAGYRVIAALDADHALVLLHSRSDISLVITSVVMPGVLDGCALARIVDRRWPEVGLLVVCGATGRALQDLPSGARVLAGSAAAGALVAMVEDLLRARIN